MATHSSILAWRIPWTEELGGLQSTGHKELDTTEQLHFTSLQETNTGILTSETRLQAKRHLSQITPDGRKWPSDQRNRLGFHQHG